MRQTVAILGTPVDILDMNQTLACLEQFIQVGRFHQVATANTDFLVNAVNDPELQHILRNADLVVADGMPLVWSSHVMGSPLPERVTGADLVPRLASLAAQKGYRVYMLGARPDVAQRAKAKLEADNPGLQIVGCVSPVPASIIEMDGEALLADIEQAAPDILLVAFGNPKQEKWIHLHRERLRNVSVCIGVGGTFDFIAGEVPRASAALQRSGFEWVHRLAHNPKYLWKRYGRDLTQGGRHLLRQWWALNRQPHAGQFEMCTARVEHYAIVALTGDFRSTALPRFRTLANTLLEQGRCLIMDLQDVVSIDSAAMGALINLQKQAADRGRSVRLVSVPPQIARVLHHSQLHEQFLPKTNSVAHALTEECHGGLRWRIQAGHDAAVVTVSGASDQETTRHLETICQCLRDGGKKVDMDVRGVSYIDSALLAVFYRLQYPHQSGKDTSVRFIAGSTLLTALTKEKLLDRFLLCEAAHVPQDAKDLPPFMLETRKTERAGGLEGTHPEAVHSFAVASMS